MTVRNLIAVLLGTILAASVNGQGSQTPIYNGVLQSNLNAAGFKILSANLSDYAGTGMSWNVSTNKFEATGGGGGGAVSSVFGRTGAVVAAINDYTFAQIGSKPTTLSGYGITDAQPFDAELHAIAGINGARGGGLYYGVPR